VTFSLWLAFTAAAAGLIMVPGPTVLVVIGYAVSNGLRPAFASMIGVALGDITAMALSLLGLGAVLAASAEAFFVLKWLGAAYLVYLGLKMWRAPAGLPAAFDGAPAVQPIRTMIAKAFTVTVLNPKGILFFSAFMPQFVDPAAPLAPQMAILGGTFVGLGFCIIGGYALLSGRLRGLFASPAAMRRFNRASGSALIGAGAMTAALKQ